MQPPGGGCSDIFGVDESVKDPPKDKQSTKTNIFGVEEIVVTKQEPIKVVEKVVIEDEQGCIQVDTINL